MYFRGIYNNLKLNLCRRIDEMRRGGTRAKKEDDGDGKLIVGVKVQNFLFDTMTSSIQKKWPHPRRRPSRNKITSCVIFFSKTVENQCLAEKSGVC
jgi:hypothetical protein